AWTFPPRKPNKSSIAQIAQPKRLQFCQRMALRNCEHQVERGDGELRQFATDVGNGKHKAGIQSAGLNGVRLFLGAGGLELQFHVRLSLAKFPERIRNYAVPG